MDRVIHFEIPADNVERAKKFYIDCFGWEIKSMPDMGYTMLTTGPIDESKNPKESGFINGGMMKKTAEIKNPIITIQVADIVNSLRIVKDNGGKTIRDKTDVGDIGIAAYFEDTEGNIIGLWQDKR